MMSIMIHDDDFIPFSPLAIICSQHEMVMLYCIATDLNYVSTKLNKSNERIPNLLNRFKVFPRDSVGLLVWVCGSFIALFERNEVFNEVVRLEKLQFSLKIHDGCLAKEAIQFSGIGLQA